jgi:hypothetical protein
MADKDLSAPQRWALLALMAVNGDGVSNPDLERMAGVRLVGQDRRRLNEEKLVRSHMEHRAYVHELTDAGFDRCVRELTAERPVRSGAAGGVAYALLGLIKRFADNENLDLVSFCQKAGTGRPEPDDIETQVRAVYRRLTRPGHSLRLARLRQQLMAVDRVELDETLRRIHGRDGVYLQPESNQNALTQEDRDSAIRIGGEDSHLIVIEEA